MSKDETEKFEKNNALSGRLLLAMPGMGDPRFHRAVIFVCAHDQNGAMGLVINQTVPGLDLGQLLKQLQIEPAANARRLMKMPVLTGGPVETARGFVLHSSDYLLADTVRIDDQFSVTGTIDALKAIAEGDGPDELVFILGYAGWSPGQLDRELQDNAWLVTDADSELIFKTPADRKWHMAIHSMGVDPAMLSDEAGHA